VGKVDQQFEHLSDAQIQNYGDRNTGAGPSGPEDDNQAIESHLGACADCRTRLLIFHRSRLGLKDRSPSPAHRPTPPTADATTTDCPTEDALRDLAAGLTSQGEATLLIQHAALCDHCGPILKAYTEDFSDDLNPEDATLLLQLESSSPEWRKRLAAKLALFAKSAKEPHDDK
jgi:hypothetical protein